MKKKNNNLTNTVNFPHELSIIRFNIQEIKKKDERTNYRKRVDFANHCGIYHERHPVSIHIANFHSHLHYIKAFKHWEVLQNV